MSYVAPSGGSLSFLVAATEYTAPAGDTLDFTLLAADPALSATGSLLLGGAATLSAGERLSASGALQFSGVVALVSEQQLVCSGAFGLAGAAVLDYPVVLTIAQAPVVIGGRAELKLGPFLSCAAKLSLTGSARLQKGLSLAISGRIGDALGGVFSAAPGRSFSVASQIVFHGTAALDRGATIHKASGGLALGGRARFASGRWFAAGGALTLRGASDVRVGCALRLGGEMLMSGRANCSFSVLTTVAGAGRFALSGGASMAINKDVPAYDLTLFVTVPAHRIEVFSYV